MIYYLFGARSPLAWKLIWGGENAILGDRMPLGFKPRLRHLLVGLVFLLPLLGAAPALAERPHGLEPAPDMPYVPDLGGLRTQVLKNHYGQERRLSEAVILRQSSIDKGAARVPAGGLYYVSETADEARPLMGDPFLLLGERATLLTLKGERRCVESVAVNKGQKLVLDEAGRRLWFDYATDHYQKPYAQLALIAPSGHWPQEFPVGTAFEPMEKIRDQARPEGQSGQLDDFYLDRTYRYGATSFTARKVAESRAEFERITYPVLREALFSLNRPWVLEVRQEDYRWFGSKRLYAFRRPEGFLVRVTDWTGRKVLGEKLLRPSTPQGYKDSDPGQEDYGLTIPGHDLHVELMINPEFMKNSDFLPTSNDVPYGWKDGVLSFVAYDNLVALRDGEAWPLDSRYKVGLEANLFTGKLQRVVIENSADFTLSDGNSTFSGPTKHSDIWNRPAFRVVAKDFEDKAVHTLYLRDRFFQRTDNLVFDAGKGRGDVDFYVGRAPTLVPLLENTFLSRLADNSYGTIAEGSRFSSYPRVISDAAFHAPDHTAPFEARLKGFEREVTQNRKGERITSAEGLVIRGSHVDYRQGRIVIPPGGLFYTSRNARNVRVLSGESFLVLGRRAHLASFESSTLVRKDFDLDFWKKQPTGDGNPVFWQDALLGENNKALRYTGHTYLDDRVAAAVNIVKYSGNNFGEPFLLAQGFEESRGKDRYTVPALFAEGSTWIIPEHVGANYIRVAEVGTPLLKSFSFTYEKPVAAALPVGQSAALGQFRLVVTGLDPKAGTVGLSLRDEEGREVAARTLGPLNEVTRRILPQHQRAIGALQFAHGTVLAELDIFRPFEDGKANLWLYTGMRTLRSDAPLESDPRFIVRPDVCGHCYQLNELLLANQDPIVLDRDHPVYDGPHRDDGTPMFRIVVDSFDGEMVQAWHVETEVKGRVFKTQNLAFSPRDNLDVLIGVNGTIEGFLRASLIERMAYKEYWRRALHEPARRGINARHAQRLQ